MFAARNLDVELAQLVADSAASTAGPVMRGPDVRSLSFEAGDLGIELDIDVKAGLVTGQVTHTGVAVVTLEVDEIEVDRATSDELGRFRLRGISLDAGRASVHVAVDGRSLPLHVRAGVTVKQMRPLPRLRRRCR